MCLGIPMQILERDERMGVAMVSGVKRRVSLDLVPEVAVGDFVIVHAGFAIQRVDEAEAAKIMEYIEEALGGQAAMEEGLGTGGSDG